MIRKYRRYRAGQRWLVALAMLACVAFHGTLILRFLLSPEQFRARTQLLLQQQFEGEVRLGECGYEFPAAFRLKDLCLCRPAERGGGELFHAKALAVDLGLLSLLRGKVVVDDLLLDEPELHLTRDDWAAMQRPSAAEARAELGRVIVRDGCIVFGKGMLFDGSPERELRNVCVDLHRERRLASGYAFAGEANSSLWGRCDLEGTLDLGGQRLDSKVVARGIAFDERLREMLPDAYKNYAKALDRYSLQGVVDLSIESSLSWADKGSIALRAAADLRDCSAAWENFPLRCTDIRGRVVFDGTNVYYQDITGRAGPATVTLSGQTTREKIDVHLVARGRPLDREVHEAAPPPLKRAWDRCGIQGGIVNVDHQSTWWRAEKRFEATVRIEVRDGRATHTAFPYPLQDLAGTLRWEEGVSHIEALRGRRGNARVQIHGQVTDAGVPDLVIEASDVPLDETLYKALGPNWRKAFDELRPEGTAGIQCTIASRDGGPDNLQYRFVVRPEGAAFCHKDFPHKITDVRGDIVVDEAGTASFRELRGRLGAIPLSFQGTVRAGAKGPEPDIAVIAPEVELGPAARAILTKEVAAVYDDLDPRGKVSVTWRLTTDPATGAARRTTEVTCLQDCSIQHKLFPMRITNLMGRLYVDAAGSTTFTGMKGRLGNAAVEAVAGRCLPGGVGGLSFTIHAAGLALNDELRAALPPAWQKVWDEVRPSGEAAAEYQLTGNPEKPDQPAQRVTIEPTDGAFCDRRFPLQVNEVTRGRIVFDQDGNATISNVQGKVHGKAAEFSGKVTTGADGRALQLDVSADELTLGDDLRRALPPEWQQVWDGLKLSGKIGATATMVVGLEKNDWRSFRLDATLRDAEATWSKLPLRLTGLRGRVEYSDGVVTLTDVTGQCAVADKVRLVGRIPRKGAGADRLQVVAQNVRLAADLLAALPADVRKALEAMKLKGAADVDLTVTTSEEGDAPTECSGLVRLRDCSFEQTQPFEQVSGDLRIDKGVVQADGGQKFEGGLSLRKLVVRKFVITEVKGALAYTRTPAAEGKAAESRLVLSDVAGSFYGGTLSAKVSLDPSGAGPMTSWLALRGADFKVFCREALGSDSEATGTLDVRVEFPAGRYKGEKGLIGDGTAAVTRGDLGQLPLTAAVLNAFSFRSPLDRAITEADAKFGITKDQLMLKELHLLGETRVLAGQGAVGFDGSLNLRLVSPRAEKSLVDILLFVPNLIREQLVQVEIRGTLSQPEVHVVAVPVIPQLVETFTDALGIWRKRHPDKPAPGPP